MKWMNLAECADQRENLRIGEIVFTNISLFSVKNLNK